MTTSKKRRCFGDRLYQICQRGDGMFYHTAGKKVYIIVPGLKESGTWSYNKTSKHLSYQMGYMLPGLDCLVWNKKAMKRKLSPIGQALPFMEPKEAYNLFRDDKRSFVGLSRMWRRLKERVLSVKVLSSVGGEAARGLAIAALFGAVKPDLWLLDDPILSDKMRWLHIVKPLIRGVGVNRRMDIVNSIVEVGIKKTLKKRFRRFSPLLVNSFVKAITNRSQMFRQAGLWNNPAYIIERLFVNFQLIQPHWKLNAVDTAHFIDFFDRVTGSLQNHKYVDKNSLERAYQYVRSHGIIGLQGMQTLAYEQLRLSRDQYGGLFNFNLEGKALKDFFTSVFDELPWHLGPRRVQEHHDMITAEIKRKNNKKNASRIAEVETIHEQRWDGIQLEGVVPLVRKEDFEKEGKAMHHCVGGYFFQVQSVFAHLETDDGDKATLQLTLNKVSENRVQARVYQLYGPCNQQVNQKVLMLAETVKETVEQRLN